MVVAIVLLVLLVLAGVAALTGHTADSRDPEYSVGRILTRLRAPESRSAS
jgi:hypothetical protein